MEQDITRLVRGKAPNRGGKDSERYTESSSINRNNFGTLKQLPGHENKILQTGQWISFGIWWRKPLRDQPDQYHAFQHECSTFHGRPIANDIDENWCCTLCETYMHSNLRKQHDFFWQLKYS